MDKRRKKAYREKQSFWIIIITVVVLFTVGALLINSRESKVNKDTAGKSDSLQESVIVQGDSDNSDDSSTKNNNTNSLVKDQYPQIKVLVEQYFDAKNTVNVDKLKKIVDNLSDDIKDKLEKEKKYIESYSNIEVYTKSGLTDDAYVVYAYCEIKFLNIDTLAPGSVVLYVVRDAETDTTYIHTYKSDSDIAAYVEALNQDEDVKEFYSTVESKLEEACKKDNELKEFYEKLKTDE